MHVLTRVGAWQVLWSMGVKHSTHHITFDGLFCVDIALEGEQVPPPSFQPACVMPLVSHICCSPPSFWQTLATSITLIL